MNIFDGNNHAVAHERFQRPHVAPRRYIGDETKRIKHTHSIYFTQWTIVSEQMPCNALKRSAKFQ